MKAREIRAIMARAERLMQQHRPGAIATVVAVEGSAHLRPGARMLVTHAGETIGGISDACLEQDVVERSREVMASRESLRVRYDTTHETGREVGLGQGIVDILIEPLESALARRRLSWLSEWLVLGRMGALASVYQVEGMPEVPLGAFVVTDDSGRADAVIGNEALGVAMLADARAALHGRFGGQKEYRFSAGTASVLVEVFHPPLSL